MVYSAGLSGTDPDNERKILDIALSSTLIFRESQLLHKARTTEPKASASFTRGVHISFGKMHPIIFFAVFITSRHAYAAPQSKGGGGGGADLIGSLLKGMGGSVPNGPAPGGCSKYEILVGMQSNTTNCN
jgi:hypothetical protein